MPPMATTFFEKKSLAHSILAYMRMNPCHEPSPRVGPNSRPFSSGMFQTVPLLIFVGPSRFGSPRIRPGPQALSLAICTTSCRTSSGLRGRSALPLADGLRHPH